MRTKAPPTAIPTMAPFGNTVEELEGSEFDGLGSARVGERVAMVACCVKYTARSPLLKPPAGALTVAPPNNLAVVNREPVIRYYILTILQRRQ